MPSPTYEPLPSTYPPVQHDRLPGPSTFPTKLTSRIPLPLKYILGTSAALLISHYVLLGASTTYANKFRHDWPVKPIVLSIPDAAGSFFRDAYPLKTMVGFHQLAIEEVAARGLDTCGDQLGMTFIEAYAEAALPYCLPESGSNTTSETSISCTPNHRGFTNWWPYPNSPCIASNLRAVKDQERTFNAVGCRLTSEGEELLVQMGTEGFLGNNMIFENQQCKEIVDHTVLVIGRQDQWNPFHVAEDLITTVVTALIAAKTAPELVSSRVQLVFNEGFGMDANHFTALWDRVGAWAPRRLHLDPWDEGVCLKNSIHSIGAGASLLSAMGVGHSYTCASTITWAASHYYRHLFGLLPSTPEKKSINVLWLSRAKLDAFAQKENDWSMWRDIRHINNEPELVNRLRKGLADHCKGRCTFEDAQNIPESWSAITTEPTVRFAMLDPMVHTLETQIHYVGHTTILVSSHGGALGLSLFLPPGTASLIELQVSGVQGNFHFQHMAYEMGQGYEMISIDRDVDVDHVWSIVESWVDRS